MSNERRVHLSRSARGVYDALENFSKEVGVLAQNAGLDGRLRELVLIHASQLNGCAYCVRVHTDRGAESGVTMDDVAQLPVWRESGVFSPRERAALELAEHHVFIHDEGLPDEAYDRIGGILSEEEYVAVSWLAISINAFNRVGIAGKYPVPPRRTASSG